MCRRHLLAVGLLRRNERLFSTLHRLARYPDAALYRTGVYRCRRGHLLQRRSIQLHLSARHKESSLADLFHGVGCPSNGLRTLCDYGCLFWDACAYLLLPFIILEVARAAAFSLLWMETAERARKVYSGENTLLRVWVYLIGGLLAAVLAFFGVYGMCAAGALVLLTGVFERYWLIGITKKI